MRRLMALLAVGLVLALAACGSSGHHAAARNTPCPSGQHVTAGGAACVPDNSTAVPITPSGTVTVKPPPVAWWVFSASKPGDVRVFHGTELAAMGACATCIYTPYGPYSTKSAAEKVAARNRDKIRAQ